MQWPQEELGNFMILQNEKDITHAINLARTLHKDQYRKGTKIPYFEHLASVACLVKLYGGSNEQIIAGFLHDSVEDQGDKITLDEIETKFGMLVRDIVADCTQLKKPGQSYREFRQHKLNDLAEGLYQPQSLLVMLADKTHNAESIIKDYILIGETLWDRFKGTKEEIAWYYSELFKAFKKSCPHVNYPPLDRFERSVRTINSFK